MDGCVSHMSVVRYDAMNELSGQQSSTVALLDARRTGVVVSSILHRDQARVYVKQVREGTPEYELSPEEEQAVEAAMAGAPAAT
jgi:ABC-type Na+ efflux pump permease subunit